MTEASSMAVARRACILLLAVVACSACSTGNETLVGPRDGGDDPLADARLADAGQDDARLDDARLDAPDDAGVFDAGVEPTDLAEICGGDAPQTLEQWEDCYLRRTCEWRVGCVTLSSYRDVQDCITSSDAVEGGRLAAERRERKRAIDQGRAQLDVRAFTQCLIRTSAARCNTALFDPACLTRFTGTIADDAGCYTDAECASPDAVCDATCSDSCCLGSCQRKFREGETCDLFASCEPGLRCNGATCVSGDVGTACHGVIDCDFDAFCDPASQRCKPRLAPGAACTDILQCGGDTSCIGLSITGSQPGHCLRNAQPGDRCDDTCHGNRYCDGSHICRALPVRGESCSGLVPCAGADTMCSSGQCVARAAVGVACGAQTCRPELFCSSELGDAQPVCAARRATGGVCRAPDHCQSYLCSGNANQPGVCLSIKNTCP